MNFRGHGSDYGTGGAGETDRKIMGRGTGTRYKEKLKNTE